MKKIILIILIILGLTMCDRGISGMNKYSFRTSEYDYPQTPYEQYMDQKYGIWAKLVMLLRTTISPKEPVFDNTGVSTVSTFQCMSIYLNNVVGGSLQNTCNVQYRVHGTTEWHNALPLWYCTDDDQYRGSVVNLTSETTYDFKLEISSLGISRYFYATTWTETENLPIASTIDINQTTTLAITSSGSAEGYILYTVATPGNGIDVNNLYDHCITINAHHIIIRGLYLAGAALHLIRLYSAHDIIVEDCEMTNWGTNRADGWGYDYNSALYWVNWGHPEYECYKIIMQNCNIHTPRSDSNNWHEYRTATATYHPEGPQAVTMMDSDGNHVFRYNWVHSEDGHSFNDGFGGNDNFGLKGFPTRDSDIYGNSIDNCWDNPIESEGGNMNVRIWNNFTSYAYAHLAIASVTRGPVYLWRNICSYSKYYDECWAEDQTNQGYILKTDGEHGQGKIYYFHNTILQPPVGYTYPGGCSHGIFGNQVTNIVTKNNIFHLNRTTSNAAYIGDDDHPNIVYGYEGSSYDYDLFNGTPYSSIVTTEVHGIFNHAPTYSQTPSYELNEDLEGIFTLDTTSYGYNTGVIIPNFNDGYTGTAPDIGAHEHGMAAMKFGPR